MKKIIVALATFMLLSQAAFACSPCTEAKIRSFVAEHVKIVKPLYKKAGIAAWDATITGKVSDYKRAEDTELALRRIYQNKEEFEQLKKWNKEKISDPILAREVSELYLSYLSNQIDKKTMDEMVAKSNNITKLFSSYRAKLDGKEATDNDLRKLLREDKDPAHRKVVWESAKQVGAVIEKELLELIKLRNKAARALGYKNYYIMSLETQGESFRDVSAIMNSLKRSTDKPFKTLKATIDTELAKKYGIKGSELRPWHYEDPFFQETPRVFAVDLDKYVARKDVKTVVSSFYKGIGMDVSDILARSDLYEKTGKQQHAYCTNIDRENDVRILTNLKNNEYWLDTLLHELGHAVYDKYVGKDVPFILHSPPQAFTTEAVAMFFGRLSMNPKWLGEMYGLSEKDVKEISAGTAKLSEASSLIFARWGLVMFNFERMLYENPDQDLNNLWWDTVEKYQLVTRPENRNRPDWASKIHFATAPIYYHNYVMGSVLASQFTHKIATLQGKDGFDIDYIKNATLGKYFMNTVFAPGAIRTWPEMVKFSTGEYLTPKYFVEQFVH